MYHLKFKKQFNYVKLSVISSKSGNIFIRSTIGVASKNKAELLKSKNKITKILINSFQKINYSILLYNIQYNII